MRIWVKICGLTHAAAVKAAIDAGADAVGFVFVASPRRMLPGDAARLMADIPPGILRVAVMRHPLQSQWDEVIRIVRPDWLQTEAEDFERLELPDNVEALPVYRDVPEMDREALAAEGRVLFEAPASGTGEAPDWDRAAELAKLTQLVLAGGLTPENVGEAIRRVRPWGVDVSSGVEAVRGTKDPARIAAFIAAVREAEREVGRHG